MSPTSAPPHAADHSASFRARGVAVPVTTPLLAGTRVRDAGGKAIEFIIPNPSGERGVYIAQLNNLRSICTPTVHDTVLFQRVAELRTVTPAGIRRVALQVALDGHAGEAAALAAERTIAADRNQRARMHALLLAGVADGVAPGGKAADPAGPDLQRRANMALRSLASALRRPPEQLAACLQWLAELFAPVGFPHHSAGARLSRLIERIRCTHAALAAWIAENGAHDALGLGTALAPVLESGWKTGDAAVRMTRAALNDPSELLKRWSADPPGVLQFAMRPDWLLDGWDQACLMWQAADDDAGRRATLLELPHLVPVLPQEVVQWTDLRIPVEATEPSCRVISRQDGWRTGAAGQIMIERNERLRARSL